MELLTAVGATKRGSYFLMELLTAVGATKEGVILEWNCSQL